MTNAMRTGWFLIACWGAANAAGQAPADQQPPSAVVRSPVNGGFVGPLQEVVGQVLRRGQPVVVVRPRLPGAMWWVQEPAVPTTPGHFKARAQFGNSETLDGAQFEVMVLLALTAAQAAPLKVGAAFEALPLEIPRSPMIVVTRGVAPAAGGAAAVPFGLPQDPGAVLVGGGLLGGAVGLAGGADAALGVDALPAGAPLLGIGAAEALGGGDAADRVIVSPAAMEEVGRLFDLRGKAPIATQPVVLVRGDGRTTPWWVQDRPQVDDVGEFSSRIRCGTDRTAPGTIFRVVVLLPTTNLELRGLSVGRSVKELPVGMPRSREIPVKRGG